MMTTLYEKQLFSCSLIFCNYCTMHFKASFFVLRYWNTFLAVKSKQQCILCNCDHPSRVLRITDWCTNGHLHLQPIISWSVTRICKLILQQEWVLLCWSMLYYNGHLTLIFSSMKLNCWVPSSRTGKGMYRLKVKLKTNSLHSLLLDLLLSILLELETQQCTFSIFCQYFVFFILDADKVHVY